MTLLAVSCEGNRPAAAENSAEEFGGVAVADTNEDFKPPSRADREELRVLPKSQAVVATDRFNSARVCGACHQEIFEHWSRSMHALAYEDPIFKSAFLRAYYETGGEAAALCLRCHSPTVTETKDFLGKQDITREGITCDYCHSISGITQDKDGVTHVTIDHSTRSSPFELHGEPPSAHAMRYRGYFARSEMCASCHDYTAANGTMVFATYSEWRASHYAREGVQCQQCHMPRLRDAEPGRVFNDHNLVGGHSSAQLMRAATVAIQEIVRDGDRVRVVVTVENSGAGHYLPTGLPSRMLVVEATATQRNRTIFRQEVVYQRVMQGEDQRPLVEDWKINLLSKYVLRDNRLSPGETRRETFVFDATSDDDVIVRVQVVYRYRPTIDNERLMEVPITEFEKVLVRGS